MYGVPTYVYFLANNVMINLYAALVKIGNFNIYQRFFKIM
jgi:hypothetical protein